MACGACSWQHADSQIVVDAFNATDLDQLSIKQHLFARNGGMRTIFVILWTVEITAPIPQFY